MSHRSGNEVFNSKNATGTENKFAGVHVEFPRSRITAENCVEDDYLLNQLDHVNDNPAEDGLPLRKWLIREAHLALEKNHKLTEVVLKPKADRTCRTQFCIKFID